MKADFKQFDSIKAPDGLRERISERISENASPSLMLVPKRVLLAVAACAVISVFGLYVVLPMLTAKADVSFDAAYDDSIESSDQYDYGASGMAPNNAYNPLGDVDFSGSAEILEIDGLSALIESCVHSDALSSDFAVDSEFKEIALILSNGSSVTVRLYENGFVGFLGLGFDELLFTPDPTLFSEVYEALM